MNCPNCGAPLHLTADQESFPCEYCRSVYVPEENEDGVRVLEDRSPLPCPVCAVPLVKAAVADQEVLYCKQCRGLLVSMHIFPGLLDELRARRDGHARVQTPLDRKAFDRHLDCPQCHQGMDTHPYDGPGNVVIDSCSRCDWNWLDSGEMSRIVRAPDHHYAQEDTYGR
ncbi:MAG: zf-TFIIB domain-containing protein [Acidobacteriia bacterium]|nr:zf-TFIIB domain-containing protein [Terriglobia bacterium]